MYTLAELAKPIQTVLGATADQLAKTTGFIKRQRNLSGAKLVRALTLGFLPKPATTLEELTPGKRRVDKALATIHLRQFQNRGVWRFAYTLYAATFGDSKTVVYGDLFIHPTRLRGYRRRFQDRGVWRFAYTPYAATFGDSKTVVYGASLIHPTRSVAVIVVGRSHSQKYFLGISPNSG